MCPRMVIIEGRSHDWTLRTNLVSAMGSFSRSPGRFPSFTRVGLRYVGGVPQRSSAGLQGEEFWRGIERTRSLYPDATPGSDLSHVVAEDGDQHCKFPLRAFLRKEAGQSSSRNHFSPFCVCVDVQLGSWKLLQKATARNGTFVVCEKVFHREVGRLQAVEVELLWAFRAL